MGLAVAHDKKQIVLGLEPTGHYWFCLATWMITNGISVVQVNPYAVKQTKELHTYYTTRPFLAIQYMMYPFISDNTISHGKAAEILGVSKYELIEIYDNIGLAYLSMDIEEVEEEVLNWKKLRGTAV